MRISGCISYVLNEEMRQNGHLYLKQDALIKSVLNLLNEDQTLDQITESEINGVLYRLAVQHSIVVDDDRIYRVTQYEEERRTAMMIAKRLMKQIPAESIEKELEEAQKVLGITLSDCQKEAVRMVFRSPIGIITGGPGTGKTTVLKVILYIHKEKYKTEVQLMAPTGRAARRMAESTGHEESSTMHMALGLYGDDEYEPMLEELSAEFVNVDEFSMVDMHLAYEFFSKVKPSARVLLVGDIHQLPSVGAGEVFRQLILCGKIPVTTLDLVYRQGKNSNIALNAKLMQQGRTALIEGEDFQMIACKGAEEAAQIVKELYVKELAVHGMDQVQILSPYKVRSAAGVIEINRTIQDLVNPPISGKKELHIHDHIFREGDKVLQNKNTEVASNGDMGILTEISEDEDNNPLARIVFPDGRSVLYEADQMDMVEHANAITIHKSQGNECQVVIIPWVWAFYKMLKRNILYTGITRAKQKVYLVGEKKAITVAIKQESTGTRNTILAERIRYYCNIYQKPTQRQPKMEQLRLAV